MSLAIRIRPFFENSAMEIREAAILLFGDLCKVKDLDKDTEPTPTSEALKEQIFTNFFLLLLHLSEHDIHIVRVSNLSSSFINILIILINFILYVCRRPK